MRDNFNLCSLQPADLTGTTSNILLETSTLIIKFKCYYENNGCCFLIGVYISQAFKNDVYLLCYQVLFNLYWWMEIIGRIKEIMMVGYRTITSLYLLPSFILSKLNSTA